MNDARYAELMAQIEGHIAFWEHRLGLSHWHINKHFYRSERAKRMYNDTEEELEHKSTAMEITYDVPRMQAVLSVYLQVIDDAEISDYRLSEIVAHEFMHIYVGMLRPFVKKKAMPYFEVEEEHLTTIIARILNERRAETTEELDKLKAKQKGKATRAKATRRKA